MDRCTKRYIREMSNKSYYDFDTLHKMYNEVCSMKTRPDNINKIKEGTVIDEEKSVRWNREEVERLNREYDKESNRMTEIRATRYKDVLDEIYKTISNETGLPIEKSEKVWSFVYEKFHSYDGMFVNLDEVCYFLYDLLN